MSRYAAEILNEDGIDDDPVEDPDRCDRCDAVIPPGAESWTMDAWGSRGARLPTMTLCLACQADLRSWVYTKVRR